MKEHLSKWLLLAAFVLTLGACGITEPDQTAETQEAQTNELTTDEGTQSVESAESTGSSEDVETDLVTIELFVDGEVQTEATQEVAVKEGDILLDVMKENFEIEEEDGFISSINGFEQDPDANRWWIFTVDDQYVEVGVAEYELSPGDTVQWTLESFE